MILGSNHPSKHDSARFFLGGVVRDQVSQTVGAHNKIRENFNPWARNKLEYELKLSAKF